MKKTLDFAALITYLFFGIGLSTVVFCMVKLSQLM